VIPDARELVAIATETEHHGQLGLERESHNEAEAAPDGQLLVTQHPQQLAVAQPETSRHRSPDNRSQGSDAQGHDAQGVERPSDAESRFSHTLGVQCVQFAQPESPNSKTYHVNPEFEPEQ
jgi:hypothetical protein